MQTLLPLQSLEVWQTPMQALDIGIRKRIALVAIRQTKTEPITLVVIAQHNHSGGVCFETEGNSKDNIGIRCPRKKQVNRSVGD